MTVYQKNNRWYFRFSINDREYNRAVQEATCKRDAEKAEIRFKNDLLQGKYELAEKIGEIPFTKLVEKYIDYARVNNSGYLKCKYIINHISGFFGYTQLKHISPMLVEKYRLHRKKKGIANSTVNRELNTLRKMFSIAVEEGLMTSNPASGKKIKRLRVENKKERFLSPEEESKFIGACYGEYEFVGDIVAFAINTGARKSEYLNLTWDCVDFNQKYVLFLHTKNGRERIIPMNPILFEILSNLYNNRISDKWVFVNPNTKKPYTDVRKSIKTVCERAEIPIFSLHNLRKTFGVRVAMSNIDLTVLQQLLGHSDISTTVKYYTPVTNKRKQDAVEAIMQWSTPIKKLKAV